MDANFSKTKVLRRPQWRAERVNDLVHNSKLKPRSSDDSYIRSYRRFLTLRSAAGGDKTKRFGALLAQPHACVANAIYYAPDTEFRHILEARILSEVCPAEIARRLKIEENAVRHYEALFFDVLRMPHDVDWVKEVIVGPPEFLLARLNGAMSDTQRAFLYRLFAYCGGPTALDSVIQCIGPTAMPDCRENVSAWLDCAAEQIVKSLSAVPGQPPLTQDTIVHLLELALEPRRQGSTSKAARKRPPSDFAVLGASIVAKLTGRPTSGSQMRRPRERTTPNSQPLKPANGSE